MRPLPRSGVCEGDVAGIMAANGIPAVTEQEAVVEFRVTVGLGQDTVDAGDLESRAAALQGSVAELPEAAGADVVVDLVKAAVPLVVTAESEDAVTAAKAALHTLSRALDRAALGAPSSILTLEAEAVPAPAHDHRLPPHPAAGRA